MAEDSRDFVDQLKRILSGRKGSVRMSTGAVFGQQPPSGNLGHLTDYLLLRVFYFLPMKERLRLRRVSRRWHQLLFDFSIWKVINLSQNDALGCRSVKKLFIKWIAHFSGTIQEVDLSGIEWANDSVVSFIAQQCNNLRRINLKNCYIVTDVSVQEIAKHCAKLEQIYLHSTGATEESVKSLVRMCKNLEGISLGCQGNCYDMLLDICHQCRGLTRISIHDTMPAGRTFENVNNVLIHELARMCSRLQYINLTWCYFVTDTSMRSIARYCRDLRTLRIRECQQVTGLGIVEVLAQCPKLETLEINRLYQVSELARGPDKRGPTETFPNLRTLRVTDTRMTDESMARITECCPNLRRLTFGEFCYHPGNVKGRCISAVVKSCRKLKWLAICSVSTTDHDLEAISAALPWLVALELGDCSRCTERGVWSLARGCPYLMYLTLTNCHAITSSLERKLEKKLPYLVSVYTGDADFDDA